MSYNVNDYIEFHPLSCRACDIANKACGKHTCCPKKKV